MKRVTPSRLWCAVLVCAAAVPLLAVPSPASAAPTDIVKTFNSPGRYEFIVPNGVTRIHVTAVGAGAGGGGSGGNNGGPLSGAGGAGGAGTTGLRAFCQGSDQIQHAGDDGHRGADGYRAHPGDGGTGGASAAPQECSPEWAPGHGVFAGSGGRGGRGAGRLQDTNYQRSSTNGEKGADGCVLLSYTP